MPNFGEDAVKLPEPLILKFLSDSRDYDHDNYHDTKCKSGWSDKLVRSNNYSS